MKTSENSNKNKFGKQEIKIKFENKKRLKIKNNSNV